MAALLWGATISLGIGLAVFIVAISKVRAAFSDVSKRDSALNWLYSAFIILLLALMLYLIYVSCNGGSTSLSGLFCGAPVVAPAVGVAVGSRAPVVALRAGESLTLSAL